MCKGTATIAKVAKKMKHDLNRRFQFAISPDSPEFDSIYVAATFLNLPYRGLLDAKQNLNEHVAYIIII